MKPPYRVPLMEEVRALPPNGYRGISTFSGCGGSCLGFKMAGFRVLWANEFVPAARDTYAANHPEVILSGEDIRDVRPEDVLERVGVKAGELDFMEGSPPCANFSTAGKRSAGWGKVKKYSDVEQRADDLFSEFARLLRGVRPRTFVAENVSGLVKGVAKGYFKRIHAELAAAGYRVEARLLDAQWLGVPQARQRIIFMGVREDLHLPPEFPAPLPYRYSIRDALPWLESMVHYRGAWAAAGECIDRPCPTITVGVDSLNAVHYQARGPELEVLRFAEHRGHPTLDGPSPTPTREELAEASIERFAIGEEWGKIRPGETSSRYFNLSRPDPDAPCPTVTATGGVLGAASVTHPSEKRKFTIGELKRIGGFPDDFILKGTYQQQWERVGRAVPPVMMRHVAEALLRVLQKADGR